MVIRNPKLLDGFSLEKLLKDCILEIRTNIRDDARKELIRSCYVERKWHYDNNGKTVEAYIDPDGNELWREISQ